MSFTRFKAYAHSFNNSASFQLASNIDRSPINQAGAFQIHKEQCTARPSTRPQLRIPHCSAFPRPAR